MMPMCHCCGRVCQSIHIWEGWEYCFLCFGHIAGANQPELQKVPDEA